MHLPWPATGLEAWLSAVRARAMEAQKAAERPARRKRAPPVEDGPTDWGKVRKTLLVS